MSRRQVKCGRRPIKQLFARLCMALTWSIVALAVMVGPAAAFKPIVVNTDQDRIEVTGQGEIHEGRGDTLQVDTAIGPDGITGRMAVRATTPGTSPNWIVFALQNPSEKPIERWLTAERYAVIGSSVIWPDLDARRIEAVTPSLGFLPERVKSDRADIFRITLEPGQTITYVAELSSERLARIYLWKPLEYELKGRDRQLFNGIMLGVIGLLAIFLTAVFAANHKAIFPSAALVAWCVLAYLCVDFGFWHKLFQLRPEDNAIYRAVTESAMAASFVIFLNIFLRLNLWHGFVRMLMGVWIAFQLVLILVAVIDPRLAATFARVSFLAIGGLGALLTFYLAASGQDRAVALIPSWLLLLVWIFGAGVTLTGQLSGDIVVPALVAGLVLIVLIKGFAVTQFAFRSFEPLYGAAPSELQLRSLAIDGAGAGVWEWHARRDEVKVSPVVEAMLGLNAGELSTKVEDFAKHLHPADRERFRLLLGSVLERNSGNIRIDLRMRHSDNSYRWFELEAASVPTTDRRALRCVGLLRDATEAKRAQERLMHDAVRDSLTGLPNRELFLDRLGVAIARAKTGAQVRPTILFINLDRFKNINSSMGLVVGDSLLLTVARRLSRHMGVQDTLARVGGDQFAILMMSGQHPTELTALAEQVRRSLRSPIKIAGRDIALTASTGIAIYDGHEQDARELLKEAEIAMYRAKRGGTDRIEVYVPEMRAERDERAAIESDLRRAIEKRQLRVLYQPIIYLPTEVLAGFEAVVRWDHPKLGTINPADIVPVTAESDLALKLGSYVLTRSVNEAARWQKELPRSENPLFISVNVSSRELFRADLIQEIRHILSCAVVPQGSLRLEITEALVMENPEQAIEILEWLKSAGAGLALDEFGAGYSSFAYLQRLPIDTIKIDPDLVSSCANDGTGSPIVRSIVALAQELGKEVIAEGVEVTEDAGFLRSIGCEFAQGFYYGEPMAERDVLQLLKVIRKSERKLRRRGFFRTKVAEKRETDTKGPGASAKAPKSSTSKASRRTSGSDTAVNSMPQAEATHVRPQSGPRPAGEGQVSREATPKPRPNTQLPASTLRSRVRTNVAGRAHPPTPPPIPLAPALMPPLRPGYSADAPLQRGEATGIHAITGGLGRQPSPPPALARAEPAPAPSAALLSAQPPAELVAGASLLTQRPPLASAPHSAPPTSDGVPVPLLASPLSVPPPPGSLKGNAPSLALEAPDPIPNLTTLPPAIAASLAKLASVSVSAAPVMQPSGLAALADADVAQPDPVVLRPPPLPSSPRR
jgi:diguanylate cyclase (GGDEF)-like protein/PAS domain S-box-containing protein